MELHEYQESARKTDQTGQDSQRAKLIAVLGLGGEAGSLLSEYKKGLRDGPAYAIFKERVAEELGDILWYVASLASQEGLSLETIATSNLEKVVGRWLEKTDQHVFSFRRFFDEAFTGEQLPRVFEVAIRDANGKVELQYGDRRLGNPLTDNAYENDGYRYHDVFHLAYIAVLGWSPVFRSKEFFDCKRKSDRRVDEVEDGGRSAVIEEAISAIVFENAERRSFYAGLQTIDYEVLRTIKDLTSHLEVKACSMKEWEGAILQGYEVWRQLSAKGSGTVVGNMHERRLTFKES